MTTTITREMLKRFRKDLDVTLAPLAERYGITLEAGSSTFLDDTFTIKVQGRTANAKSQSQLDAELYDQNAAFYGLPPRGTEVKLGCDTFIIVGMCRAPKNNIVIHRKRDGREYRCSRTQLPRSSNTTAPTPTLSLEEFTAQVNALEKAAVDRLNADPTKLFGAAHIPYPPQVLAIYHTAGLTPQQALDRMAADAAAEMRAEARAS